MPFLKAINKRFHSHLQVIHCIKLLICGYVKLLDRLSRVAKRSHVVRERDPVSPDLARARPATTPAGYAETLAGRVVGIRDGDTLTVLVAKRLIKVRLADIDAPERRQPFGTRSRQSLVGRCYNKEALHASRSRSDSMASLGLMNYLLGHAAMASR